MASSSDHDSIVRWLGTPQAYASPPERVERIETHISQVFLAGAFVYKLKKPVKYSFLDFSTLQARERACREEVRLNRRLAADWYVGVVAITLSADGRFELDGDGEVVDWLVQMRRLPTELSMGALLGRGELSAGQVDRLVERLVDFQKSLSPVPVDGRAYIDGYRLAVRGNLCDLQDARHALPESVVRRVHGFQLQLLLLCRQFFDERVRAGRIVDGHGDLRPEHICFTNPIAIFDCIEFSAELRRIDVADELAFLAAECDFLNADWVGRALLEGYQAKSGDRPPAVLFQFYKSYRACVRAKVAALRADQLQGAARDTAADEALRHLTLADLSIQPWLRPLVIVVGGVAETGKTTLALALAEALGAQVLRTDVLRQELFGSGSHAAQPDAGVYSPQARAQVYDEMLRRLQSLHSHRISVILDGTFSTVDSLRAVQETIGDMPCIFLAVECVCRAEVAYARIGGRLAEGRDASEARPEMHDIQRMRWQTWPLDIPQIQIDTEQANEVQIEQVVRRLSSWCPER